MKAWMAFQFMKIKTPPVTGEDLYLEALNKPRGRYKIDFTKLGESINIYHNFVITFLSTNKR